MTASAMVLDEATVATLFERADIILIRGNGLISRLIRWATSHRERVVFNSDVRPDIAGGLGFPQAEERLRLTTPAHFALAANFGALEVVAERIGGGWGTPLTRT